MSLVSDIKNDNVLIRIDKYSEKDLKLTLRYDDGELITLGSGDQVIFGAKRRKSDSNLAMKIVGTSSNQDATTKVVTLTISASKTANLSAGRYFCNISVSLDSVMQSFELDGYFLVCDGLIRPTDFT